MLQIKEKLIQNTTTRRLVSVGKNFDDIYRPNVVGQII